MYLMWCINKFFCGFFCDKAVLRAKSSLHLCFLLIVNKLIQSISRRGVANIVIVLFFFRMRNVFQLLFATSYVLL